MKDVHVTTHASVPLQISKSFVRFDSRAKREPASVVREMFVADVRAAEKKSGSTLTCQSLGYHAYGMGIG